jgi:enoyl-CoA hydratase/3-hydroxyacyl-CoA dehydrogenase
MPEIRKVGVIGAGTMGSGIAQKIAQEGINVILVDIKEEFVQRGLTSIRNLLNEGVQKKLFTPQQVEQILSRIEVTTQIERLSDADVVIEAVFEDMQAKKQLFSRLDSICDRKTVFATNTSSFSVSELAESTKRQDRFIGLHYFYHPAKNRLLEIIPGKKTSGVSVELGKFFSSRTGKTGIIVKDSPGFAVNRFFVPWLNEATRILGEGIADTATIDAATKNAFGIGMGPFVLMNVTGVPIAYHSAATLGEKFGDFYKPSGTLKKQFESGAQWQTEGTPDASKFEVVSDRLLGVVFLVVCQIAQEGVCSAADIDRGAEIGLRWAFGPFEKMNSLTMEKSYKLVENVARKYALNVPANLKEQKEGRREWEIKYVETSVSGAVAQIIINRPETLNALNPTVVRQLAEEFDRVNARDDIRVIVISGAGGKAFVAGADIAFFIDNLQRDNFQAIYDFTKEGHELLTRIDESKKLVIAKMDGVALGGGLEVALAADCVVASTRSSMSFPETGIGIYPGLAGMWRTAKYVGKELAKYLVLTGRMIDARTAHSIGLVEYICDASELDEKVNAIALSPERAITKAKKETARGEVPPEFEKIISLFSDENIASLLDWKRLKADNEQTAKIAKAVSYRAPIAIRMANEIIDKEFGKPLREAIKIELENLQKIFGTADALEGLKSVVERRRPTYRGE